MKKFGSLFGLIIGILIWTIVVTTDNHAKNISELTKWVLLGLIPLIGLIGLLSGALIEEQEKTSVNKRFREGFLKFTEVQKFVDTELIVAAIQLDNKKKRLLKFQVEGLQSVTNLKGEDENTFPSIYNRWSISLQNEVEAAEERFSRLYDLAKKYSQINFTGSGIEFYEKDYTIYLKNSEKTTQAS